MIFVYISQTLERDKLTANYSAVKTAGSTPRRVVGFGDYVEKEELQIDAVNLDGYKIEKIIV